MMHHLETIPALIKAVRFRRKAAAMVILLELTGCAALSDVTPTGPDTYMATAHSNDVNARVDEQKAKVMQSATEFCHRGDASVQVIRLDAGAPPPGRPPSAQLDFRCKVM
jgi:hypothetical protein